jgi:CheY-like chemotaxis protein
MSVAAVQKNTWSWSYVLDEPTRLLIADDDPILREFASVHLSSPAATIETAPDGAAALSRLNDNQFDLALLDIEMPTLDGFALLEAIRSDPRHCTLPVIMLTALEDIASIDRAFSLGADSFVTKPVNWRLLSYHVRYVLRTSRAQRELRQAKARAEACEASQLRALEGDYHAVLESIAQHAGRCRGEGASPGRAQESIDRIEELAAAAMRRWRDLQVGTAGAARGEIMSVSSRA